MQTAQDASLDFDVAVIGGGPAGLGAALALAKGGARTVLIARRIPYADNRTTALLGDSVTFLDALGVWSRCAARAAALQVMRLVDDSGRLVRAPEVRFGSGEIGLDAFGYNIANRDLIAEMETAASDARLLRLDDEALQIVCGDRSVQIACRGGPSISARLVIGADGRNSLCRREVGIDMAFRELNQAALTCNVRHSRPHGNISTEFHTADGPCVFVPLEGDRSSVVWVMPKSCAQRLARATSAELTSAIERQSHFHLGTLHIEEERHVFPLAFGEAKALAARRVALIGEAAHVLPPIGAQGLNLGLRDAAAITEIALQRLSEGQDPGDAPALDRYIRERRGDVAKRNLVVGIANQSLLIGFLPFQILRAGGMHLMNASGPLRRFVMAQAIGSGTGRVEPTPALNAAESDRS